MTRIIVSIALIGSLTACGMSRDTTNLPVRKRKTRTFRLIRTSQAVR
jgi:hypothetical protein